MNTRIGQPMEQDIHLSRNGLGQYRVPWVDQSLYSPHGKSLIVYYYIDRCDLWGFIREINSGISHVRYHFFPPELLLHKYKCGGYVLCCVTVNTHTIVN